MYERFVQLLQENKMTAYRVSKETGVTQTTLSDWKTGRAIPRTATLQKIADYFGVSLDWLTGTSDFRNEEEVVRASYNWGPAFDNDKKGYICAYYFCNWIAALRNEQNVEINEMADLIGIDREQYSAAEDGFFPITEKQAEVLCKRLGIEISQVLLKAKKKYNDNVRKRESLRQTADEEYYDEEQEDWLHYFGINFDEEGIIKRYRQLDKQGINAVKRVLNEEYERSKKSSAD